MNTEFIKEYLGAFAISLGIVTIWLVIAYLTPYFRKQPKFIYSTAFILAVLPQLVIYCSPAVTENFLGAVALVAYVIFMNEREKRKTEQNKVTVHKQQS